MTDDIVSKISDELRKGINSEAQVLYLLVQIRKTRQALGNRKTLLDFYRDWACHVQLTHNNAVEIFLNRFETFVDSELSARDIASKFISTFPAFFKLDELKNEMKVFLTSESLDTTLTDNQNNWNKFAKHLLNILKDCSIKRSGSSGKIIELILEVNDNGNSQFKFRLSGRRDCPICKLKWK